MATPPASSTHFLRYAPTLFRWQWPGTKDSYELHMPMNGFSMSRRFMPVA
jgi:hypothetical protein